MHQNNYPEPEGLFGRLRRETSSRHAALDHSPFLAILLTSDISTSQYASSLNALYQAWAVIETRLERLFSDPYDQVIRTFADQFYLPRRQALEADLSLLGMPTPQLDQVCVPPYESVAEMVGRLYVLNGGQLGGALIEKRLKATAPELPRRFFGHRFPDLRERWQQFAREAEVLVASHVAADDVVAVANATFDHFVECLTTA